MESLDVAALPERALVLVDSAPVIYVLERRPVLARYFEPLFAAHARGAIRLAITAAALAEVMQAPLLARNEALVRRYRAALESWRVVELDPAIAETAARMRARFGLDLGAAVQAASAVAIDCYALVTHDRDYSRVTSLRVMT